MKAQPVVILGGGAVGLCSAYYALRRGLEVTIIQSEAEGGDNCSMRNAGFVVPSHFVPIAAPGVMTQGIRWMLNPESPFFVRPRLDPAMARWGWIFYRHCTERHVAASGELLRDLNLESRRLFSELAADEDFGLQKRGLLMLCKTQKGLDEEAEIAEAARRLDLEVEVLDAKSTAALNPDVTMDILGSVHYAQDCHLDPTRFLESIRTRVKDLGGMFVDETVIDGAETAGGKVTALTSGSRRFEAGQFVIAGGAWSAQILAHVGIKLPLQPGKGYSLTLEDPPEQPSIGAILAEAKVTMTPLGGGVRIGGTMEIGKLDFAVNPARVRGILKGVHAYFPRFSEDYFEDVTPWVGLRPVSADGLPYLGRTSRFSNLIIASGHAMMGLSLGPVSGRLVSDLLVGDPPFRPIEALAPGRF